MINDTNPIIIGVTRHILLNYVTPVPEDLVNPTYFLIAYVCIIRY